MAGIECRASRRQRIVLRNNLLQVAREVRHLNLHLKVLVDAAVAAFVITAGAFPKKASRKARRKK